jgi:uncharacterized protein (TIGR01777 family)
MHLLVTGSSGLIGSALVDAAVARGDTVSRLVRRSSTQEAGRSPAGTTDVSWDPDAGHVDLDALATAGPVDGVVHLAGAGVGDKRWNPARKRLILDSRTRGTDLVARTVAALDPLPRVLVSASAVGWYGDRGDEVLTESEPSGPGFLAGVCVAWEAATAPADEAGVRTVHLRTGIVLSASGGALAKQLPLFRLGIGGRVGSGRQYRSWITLDDEVGVILHCLDDASLAGAVNATAPSPATDAQLAKAIGTALHRPSVLAVPVAALKVALGSEMATDMVLASQRALPSRLVGAGFTFRHTDLDEAVHSVLVGP